MIYKFFIGNHRFKLEKKNFILFWKTAFYLPDRARFLIAVINLNLDFKKRYLFAKFENSVKILNSLYLCNFFGSKVN